MRHKTFVLEVCIAVRRIRSLFVQRRVEDVDGAVVLLKNRQPIGVNVTLSVEASSAFWASRSSSAQGSALISSGAASTLLPRHRWRKLFRRPASAAGCSQRPHRGPDFSPHLLDGRNFCVELKAQTCKLRVMRRYYRPNIRETLGGGEMLSVRLQRWIS